MRLAVHDERIDAAADVVHRRIARDLGGAGIGIDLDFADGAAVGKNRIVHLVIGCDRESILQFRRQGEMRVQREMGGMGVTAFVRVNADRGSLWMLLDSGNMGPTLLSPGALSQLNSSTPPTSLAISGIGPHAVDTANSESAIYDGNLGWPFIRDFDIALDLQHNRIWWRPAQSTRP